MNWLVAPALAFASAVGYGVRFVQDMRLQTYKSATIRNFRELNACSMGNVDDALYVLLHIGQISVKDLTSETRGVDDLLMAIRHKHFMVAKYLLRNNFVFEKQHFAAALIHHPVLAKNNVAFASALTVDEKDYVVSSILDDNNNMGLEYMQWVLQILKLSAAEALQLPNVKRIVAQNKDDVFQQLLACGAVAEDFSTDDLHRIMHAHFSSGAKKMSISLSCTIAQAILATATEHVRTLEGIIKSPVDVIDKLVQANREHDEANSFWDSLNREQFIEQLKHTIQNVQLEAYSVWIMAHVDSSSSSPESQAQSKLQDAATGWEITKEEKGLLSLTIAVSLRCVCDDVVVCSLKKDRHIETMRMIYCITPPRGKLFV